MESSASASELVAAVACRSDSGSHERKADGEQSPSEEDGHVLEQDCPRVSGLTPAAAIADDRPRSTVRLVMPEDGLDALIAEQVSYYRARAAEYDSTVPIDNGSRATLLEALDAFGPRGQVLELACGTGQWTVELARHASYVTAVDASPEMIALNRARVSESNVRYVQADLFRWSPPECYDVVFFAAWLSHVPPQLFEEFWAFVASCLNEGGRIFFIDEVPAVADHERLITTAPAPAVERSVGTGRQYRAVKVLYEPGELRHRLAALGWDVDIGTVGWRFLYGSGEPDPSIRARLESGSNRHAHDKPPA